MHLSELLAEQPDLALVIYVRDIKRDIVKGWYIHPKTLQWTGSQVEPSDPDDIPDLSDEEDLHFGRLADYALDTLRLEVENDTDFFSGDDGCLLTENLFPTDLAPYDAWAAAEYEI